MNSATVRELKVGDEAIASAAIVLAFAADPMARWAWPDPQVYLAAMPRMVRAFGGKAFANRGAHSIGDGAGAALWLPPGIEPDDAAMSELMRSTVKPARLEETGGIMKQMESFHPHEPHWYLPLIGVDPAHQGRGLGDILMSYALERCDRDKLPAYLESSNPRNISLYRRHGFEPVGTIQAASSPMVVPMLRRARR